MRRVMVMLLQKIGMSAPLPYIALVQITDAKMLPNGDQKMPKTSQMATKMDPNLCPNRGQAACAGMVNNIFVFFEFLGRFWEPFGSQFGAKSLEKHIQKYVRKSVLEKYGKSRFACLFMHVYLKPPTRHKNLVIKVWG